MRTGEQGLEEVRFSYRTPPPVWLTISSKVITKSGAAFQSVFERQAAPDLIRGGYRFV
jgi:hypothetical protein